MNYYEIEQEMKNTYNAIAYKYEKEAEEDWKDKEIIDDFLKYLKTHSSILDIACGTGELLKYYDKKEFKTTGIDISTKMIEIAKKKAPNSNLINMSLYKIDNIKEKYDAISATFILVHIPKEKINEVINKINSRLKNKGVFLTVFTTKQKEGLQKEPLDNNYNYYAINYSNEEISRIINNNGFKILKNGIRKINDLDIGYIIGRKENE